MPAPTSVWLRVIAVGAGLVACSAVRGIAVATPATATEGRAVDEVFTAWTGSDRPGCAVAVSRDGTVLYARGYGMANLEASLPNGPDTVFDVGSVSKQFTAMAVLLLVDDGKLGLDDDIRRYLPEIPDYGSTVTVRHLLQHTSGLRNYTDLFDLVGVPEVSLTTTRDALDLVARQRGANFRPGQEFLYSDTNYFLAGEIVHRVSGQSLRDFAQARIFGPLGMTQTRFSDRPREIVPRRAIGYEPTPSGYLNYQSNFEQVGDGSVLTTVRDLARWQGNFDQPKVGSPRVMELMTTPGRLASGAPTPYGMGVFVDDYRGLPWLHHDGEWVGYRAALSRFPTEHLSVAVTCNTIGAIEPMALNLRVAEVYLHDRWRKPSPSMHSPTATADAGLFWSPERGSMRRLVAVGDVLMLGDAADGDGLMPVGPREYRSSGETASTYRFINGGTGVPWQLEVESFGNTAHYYRVPLTNPDPAALPQYAGTYASPDVPAPWRLVVENGQLIRRQPYAHDVPLDPLFADTFVGALSEGAFLLHFVRDDSGRLTGLLISGELMRPLLFTRAATAP